jgi:lipoate-protein ligase A
MMEGRKIAGAAHRRTRKALLHQGSIQHPELPVEFRAGFARLLCDSYVQAMLTPPLLERAQTLSESRYSSESWLTRR